MASNNLVVLSIKCYEFGKNLLWLSIVHNKQWNRYLLYITRKFSYTKDGSGGAKILVWGGRTSDKISYMNSSQVLYCNGVTEIKVLKRHSARMYSSKTFEEISKNL